MTCRRMKRLLGQKQLCHYYYHHHNNNAAAGLRRSRLGPHRHAATNDTTSIRTFAAAAAAAYGYRPDKDYLTTDGVVEGVWIFCRHGDRLPSRCLSPPHRRHDEAAYWMTKLPRPDSAAAFESFSRKFPLDIHPGFNQGRFIDVVRNPFGFLTQQGLEQLNDVGHAFFDRYNQHGHHFPGQKEWRWEVATDFLSVWDVQVYSTNYLRTVMSVQSFLDGLLGTHLLLPGSQQQQARTLDPMVRRELRVPNHSWKRVHQRCNNSSNNNDADDQPSPGASNDHAEDVERTNTENNNCDYYDDEPLVKVQVRDVSNDPLNAFDRNPDLIANLTAEVMQSPEFQKRDGSAAPLAARLANTLPGLYRRHVHRPVNASSSSQSQSQQQQNQTSDFSHRSPSGINWVEAADHFVCRAAHGVDYSKFSDLEHDDRVEPTLAAMAQPVLTHLAWRFRQWYQNKRLLAVIAAPPLREVANQMAATPALSSTTKHPFVIYSCHDITILGLLYGIGADFLADDERAGWRFWPAYASTLTFELVRITDDTTTTTTTTADNDKSSSPRIVSNDNNNDDSHVVRVMLNGKPVLCARAHKTAHGRTKLVYPGNGPEHMLQVSDFMHAVKRLEQEGGFDYDSLLGRRG